MTWGGGRGPFSSPTPNTLTRIIILFSHIYNFVITIIYYYYDDKDIYPMIMIIMLLLCCAYMAMETARVVVQDRSTLHQLPWYS